MPHFSDARHGALRAQFPLAPPHTNDLLFVWAEANGGTGKTLNDRIYSMLIAQGAAPGHVNDMWYTVLGLNGATGSLNDRMFFFWDTLGGNFGGGPGVSNWQQEGSTDAWATESGGVWLTEAP